MCSSDLGCYATVLLRELMGEATTPARDSAASESDADAETADAETEG